jgi:hypothetical protein
MSDYLKEVEGKDFTDLASNPDFQKDLLKFFTGSRYSMSRKELQKLTPKELAGKFVEHMRWQDTNEATALLDLNYAKNKETTTPEELQAFGSLMTAYDRAESGGTGYLSAAGDYLSAFVTSPSTVGTVGTLGWGIFGKLGAKATSKAAQMTLRQEVADAVRSGVSKKALQDKLKGSIASGAVKGGATSFAIEGAIGGAHSSFQGETREEAGGANYGAEELLRDALISGTIGGSIGSAARALDSKRQRELVGSLMDRASEHFKLKEVADKAAKDTLAAADIGVVNAATDRAVSIANTFSAKEGAKPLDPLDPKLVEEGNLLKQEVLVGKVDRDVTPTLSVSTIRAITAATVEIATELKIDPRERISSAVSKGLRDGTISSEKLEALRGKYNLTKEQMSYIYLADLSQAGKTLAEASFIARQTGKKASKESAETEFKSALTDLSTLSQQGVSTISEVEAANIVAKTFKSEGGVLGKIYRGLQDADATRIAFMTAQIGTTAANTATSAGNLLIDMSDQFWKNIASATVGRNIGDTVQRRWVGGTLSTIKGMTWGKTDAMIFRELLLEDRPTEYKYLFHEATRPEVAVKGNTAAAKASRLVNILNSSVDSVFKEASLYASVDRSLRELNDPSLGKDLGDFLSKNLPLDSLPKGLIEKAADDARRFTFQRTYYNDKSAFGQVAQTLSSAHEKLPFVVSGALGMPFPRYIANHLEHVNDYTPIGIVTGGLAKLDSTLYKDVTLVGDPNKTGADRFARQMTGASLILLGAYTAAQKEGKVDYSAIETETGVLDLERTAGPWLMSFYLGDLLYRWKEDLPTKDVLKEMVKISLGTSDLGFQTGFIEAVAESAEEGEISKGLARSLGDIAATFTYPLTIARDFAGQINPELITTPYTKEVFGGSLDEPSTYGESSYLDEVIRRATRFLPEVNFVQYNQSFNGKTAIPYYSPDSPVPVGTFNPLSKQLGFSASPRPNQFQQEMSVLGVKLFEVYNSRVVPNPAVEVVVSELLGKSLPKKFETWRSQVKHGGRFGDLTYDEISASKAFKPEERRALFLSFFDSEVKVAKSHVESAYESFLVDKPRAAAGYIRNMYVIEEVKLKSQSNNKDIYDTAVSVFTRDLDTPFKTASDYLADSESVQEELVRRQQIMQWSRELKDGFKPFPTVKYRQ